MSWFSKPKTLDFEIILKSYEEAVKFRDKVKLQKYEIVSPKAFLNLLDQHIQALKLQKTMQKTEGTIHLDGRRKDILSNYNKLFQEKYMILLQSFQQLQAKNTQIYQQLIESEKAKIIAQKILMQNSTLKSQLMSMKQKHGDEIQQYYKKYSEEVHSYQTKVEQKQAIIQLTNFKFNQIVQQLEQAIFQLSSMKQELEYLKESSKNALYSQFFNNDNLYNNFQAKKFIADVIINKYHRNINHTKLLYQYDPKNKMNFHLYFDGFSNIMLIVKLKNSRILACFSSKCFEKNCIGEDAFIMVFDTRKVFQISQEFKHKAITYDQFNIIFGNSEIRLKTGEKSIFSNFGIANKYFQSGNETVDGLFGDGNEKTVQFESYQIYQIIFEPEQIQME